MTPAWILDIFAAIMLVVAAVSAARLVAARPWQPGAIITDTDISHLLMGIAMAGMLASSLTTLPNGAWAVVFGVLTVWFGYRVLRDYRASGARALAVGHCAPHLVHSAAMLYMFLAITGPVASGGAGMSGMSGMTGMSTLSYPTLAFLFALILAGYAIWDLDQLSSLRRGFAVAVAGPATPALVGAPAGTVGTGTAVTAVSVLNSAGTVVGCRIAMGVTMALILFLMI
jgi:Domain of unknown function (DUF5134)